jgi:hypothetical protein
MALAITALCATLAACKRTPPPPPVPVPLPKPPAATAPTANPPAAPLPPSQQIPRDLLRVCPAADPADFRARDEAAARLSKLDVLLNNTETQLLWGIHEAESPVDPTRNKTIQLEPLVAVKLYLSLFMFSGEPITRTQGPYVVVEIPAKFRSGLPAGDYSHPLWHSADEWDAYLGAKTLTFVFIKEHLGAIYVPASAAPSAASARHIPWDDHWHWTDSSGGPQPRAAEFSYLFSQDNPNVAPLQATYTTLREKIRAQSCLKCHMPDNKHDVNVLVLLDYPNQALAARHSLAAILKENGMPPGDLRHGIEPGFNDEPARKALITLADDFEAKALEALYFESDKRGVPRPVVLPLREPPPKDY